RFLVYAYFISNWKTNYQKGRLIPCTHKCLPFTLKSSRTSTYEITRIYIYTQSMHPRFILYVYMHGSLYASVYRCICMEVYMYVRVFIGVYAWKFICMCEC
ncbi:hypothetical protein PO909_001493, partial [Leuciscus waleckii]